MIADTSQTICGINPGLVGPVARILPDQAEALVATARPTGEFSGRRFDAQAMVDLFRARPIDLAVLEAVPAAPVTGRFQGTTSVFGPGRGLCLGEGMLVARAVPHRTIRPRIRKELVLAGKGRDKPASVALVRDSGPSALLLPILRDEGPPDGLADAPARVEYGRRKRADRSQEIAGIAHFGQQSPLITVMASDSAMVRHPSPSLQDGNWKSEPRSGGGRDPETPIETQPGGTGR